MDPAGVAPSLTMPPDDPRTDEALIAAIARGDGAAWSPLLGRHQDRLFAVCLRMSGDPDRARDLAHDTIVKIVEGIGSFDGRARFTTWMTRVAMNVCLSHMRKERLRRHASLDAMSVWTGRGGGASGASGASGSLGRGRGEAGGRAQSREPEVAAGIQQGEQIERLQRALLRLDPEQRGILILRDVHELDYAQIAATLEVAVGTVKSRLFRARAALRDMLEEPDE